jgi:hypothetical protein
MPSMPAIGSLVCRAADPHSTPYRVTWACDTGCRVEATVTEVATAPGRAPRKLAYDERSFLLSCTGGTLIDDRWRAWKRIE